MERRTLHYIAQACAGEQLTGEATALATRVCTDSRTAREGDVFFALRGDRFDGHRFLAEVVEKGAVAVVVERASLPVPPLRRAVIAVENTREALGRLAARYRSDFHLPVIAVGGSNGKSTTKELIASVLRQKFSTLWSEASFNNDVGVPLTLLKLESHHQAAVIEVGTNHPGELAPLVAMSQPQWGVITSLGREHLEFFGNLDGVLREESGLAELLPPDGKLFLNTASDLAEQLAQHSRAPVIRIGPKTTDDWSVRQVHVDDHGTRFLVRAPRAHFDGEFRVNLLGQHQAWNALLAMAVGAEMGLTAEQVRRGLAECQPMKMRLQLLERQGVRILDDAYNANADSILVALQTLRDLPCAGRRIAVLGDMAELGEHTKSAHIEVGRHAAELGLDHLITVGILAHTTAEAARAAGLHNVFEFRDGETAVEAIKNLVRRGDVLLLKASRLAGFERLSEALRSMEVSSSVENPSKSSAPLAWTGAGTAHHETLERP